MRRLSSLEKGKINLQTLMASILFKSALIGIGYSENDFKLKDLRGIFKFLKIFRKVSEAIRGIMTAIKETSISL